MRRYYYLVVCYFLIDHINLNIAEETNDINLNISEKVALSKNINQLLAVETKLQQLQSEVSSSIKAALQNGRNNDITIQSPYIEKDLQFLKNEISKIIENETLEKLYESTSGQSKSFQSNLTNDKPPSDIIADIREKRFELAQEKLEKINDPEEVSKIIAEAYENSSHNFDLLAEFIESLTAIHSIYASVNALLNEMIENDHHNPFNCIRLAKVLETKFLNFPKVDFFTNKFGQFTYNKLKELIRGFTLEALNAAVIKGEFDGDGEMDELTTAVYLYDAEEWENIIYEFVDSNIDSISGVLAIITSHRLLEQRVRGLNVLYWLIQFKHDPKSELVLEIASALKDIRSDSEFQKLNPSLTDLMDKIIENLPTCARNLFFLPSACLYNQGAGVYLTAHNSSLKNDSKRRQVFSTDPLPESHWYFNRTDKYFVISSRTYENELLFAANIKHSSYLRHVFSRIAKGRKQIEERTKWIIELDKDICYVKSAKYDEYLITSNYYFGNNLRYVFTWVPQTFFGEPQFQWQIRDCN